MTFSQTDWGRTPETMGTYFRNNGDVLSQLWGRTFTTMGIHSSAIGDSLYQLWGFKNKTGARFHKNEGSFFSKRALVFL